MTGDNLLDLSQRLARTAAGALAGFLAGAAVGLVAGTTWGWTTQPQPPSQPFETTDVAIKDLPRARASAPFN